MPDEILNLTNEISTQNVEGINQILLVSQDLTQEVGWFSKEQ